MIVKIGANPDPMTKCIAMCNRDVGPLQLPIEKLSIDFPFCRCPVEFKVYASQIDDADQLNDISPLLFRKVINADTLSFSLEKNGVEVLNDTQIRNGDAGEFYDVGTWTTLTAQEKYIGIVIHWRTILINHGHGTYVLKADKVILGQPTIEVSPTFILRNFGLAAKGTVRIDSIQSGKILGAEFNYTEMLTDGRLGWPQQVRINGEFIPVDPTSEKDYLKDGNSQWKQIQRENVDNYTLNTKLIPGFLGKIIVNDYLLGNDIKISDYNPNMNVDDFVLLPVTWEQVSNFVISRPNKSAVYSFDFTGIATIKKSNP